MAAKHPGGVKPARRQTLALQATLRLRRNGAQVRLVGASPSWSFSRCSALKQGPALGNLHMHVQLLAVVPCKSSHES